MNLPLARDMTARLALVTGDEEKRTPQPESKALRNSTEGIRRRMARTSGCVCRLERAKVRRDNDDTRRSKLKGGAPILFTR